MVIKGYDVWPLLKKTGKEIGEDKVTIYAAQMAYTLFFSLFPLILFAAAVFSLIADQQTVMRWISGNVGAALPPDVAGLLQKTMESVLSVNGAPGILSFGLLTALWSGSAIFGSMTNALNAAYDVDESRPFWKKQLVRLGAMVATGLVILAASLILLNGEGIVRWIGGLVGLGETARTLWAILQIPLAIALVVLSIALLYYFLPNTGAQDRSIVLFCALLTTVLWIAATIGFRFYVQNFHAVNPAYGAIGAVMVLLTWMFYSMFVFLAVGELSSELQAGTARVGARASEPPPREAAKARHGADQESVPRDRALVPIAAQERVHAELAASVPVTIEPITSAAASGDGDGARRAAPRPLTPRELSSRSLISFIGELAEHAARLVKREVALARIEAAAIFRAVGAGTMLTAGGGVVGLLGLLTLVSSIVLVAGDQWLPRDLYWVSALVVTIVTAVAAWAFLRRGMNALAPRAMLRETRRTVQADRDWAEAELTALRERARAAVERERPRAGAP